MYIFSRASDKGFGGGGGVQRNWRVEIEVRYVKGTWIPDLLGERV